MRAIILISILLSLLNFVFSVNAEGLPYYPSSDPDRLSGNPSFTYDFDVSKDLSPADQRLLVEAEDFLSDDEKEKFCNDWRDDPGDPYANLTANSEEDSDRRKLTQDIRQRLSELESRVVHTHGRRLCSWKAASGCGCLRW